MPVASQYPELQLPEVDIFNYIFARNSLPWKGSKVIYQDADDQSHQYTYDDVHQLSLSFGQRLIREYGIHKGDRIAVVTPNDIDYPPVVFGILWAGGVVSPANPGYTVSELAYQLRDSGAKLVVAHHAAVDTVTQACVQAGLSERSILILGNTSSPSARFKHWKSTKSPGRGSYRSPDFDPKNDIAFLVYSSGTTGRPKGVMITHYNMTSNVRMITACEAGKLSSTGSQHIQGIPDAPPAGDKVLACLPFFHIYGLTSLVVAPLHNGIHTVVLAKFEIEKFCTLIEQLKITFIYIVPPMALLLAKHPNIPNYDLSSLRMTNSGAAPLTKELQEAVYNRTGVRMKQGYGLSETSPTTHEQRWEDWNQKIGTIGRLMPNMEAKFCTIAAEDSSSSNEAGPKEVPVGEVGELYLKGPNVFKGYWNNPTATAECLDTQTGWFRTGDIGFVDRDGDFFITDRVKELIKYKGFQVPPAELEGYLLDHEFIDDVVVVGVDSKLLGTEVPRAYAVRRGGMKAVRPGDEEKIVEWLAAKVANHKKLRGGIKFVEAVPKSPSGKLLRRLIRDQARKEFELIERGVKAKL